MKYNPEYTVPKPKMTLLQRLYCNISTSYRQSLYPSMSPELQKEYDELSEDGCGETNIALKYEFITGRDLYADINMSALFIMLYTLVIGIVCLSTDNNILKYSI